MAHLTGSLNKAEVAMRTEALSLLKRGASIYEVAAKFGIIPSRVKRWRKKAGLAPKRRKWSEQNPPRTK